MYPRKHGGMKRKLKRYGNVGCSRGRLYPSGFRAVQRKPRSTAPSSGVHLYGATYRCTLRPSPRGYRGTGVPGYRGMGREEMCARSPSEAVRSVEACGVVETTMPHAVGHVTLIRIFSLYRVRHIHRRRSSGGQCLKQLHSRLPWRAAAAVGRWSAC